ncbi:hypothetical protein BHAP_1711 [Bifidobacterium hapali]|uniref:Uncharacterized protein n=2 Tax=Bifidobacterium hapali TaxID=1630172 RepID=A0A261FY51_9BIFI|nr:hypothetical protein BHAP_1711 [Bifidobacterium hapali]
MQTRHRYRSPREAGRDVRIAVKWRRKVTACLAVFICAGLSLSLSGCSMPRYVGRAESEQTMSACERSYVAASSSYDVVAEAGKPLSLRWLLASRAQSQWINVAADCTDRFAEGVIRAAQASLFASRLAVRLGITDNSGNEHTAVSLDNVTSLDVSESTLTGMALAEDRAGFSVEVLAARSATDATIAIADEHKATGERLISLANAHNRSTSTSNDSTGTSSAINDPRQKVYDVSSLLTNANDIVDPATGLRASTYAIVEINCAREELAAVNGQTSQTDKAVSDTSSTGNASPSSAGSSANSSGSSNDHTSQNSNSHVTTSSQSDGASTSVLTNSPDSEHTKSMRTLAQLISSRVARAFTAGYPAFDHALFTS